MTRSHLRHPHWHFNSWQVGRPGQPQLHAEDEHILPIFDADCGVSDAENVGGGTFCNVNALVQNDDPADGLPDGKPPSSAPKSRNGEPRVKAWLHLSHSKRDQPDEPPSTASAKNETFPSTRQGTFRGAAPHEFKLLASIWREISRTISYYPAETGGFLGGSRESYLVNAFCFDRTAHRTGVTYTPDYHSLNGLLEQEWNPQDIDFLGFGHSHPGQFDEPSDGDLIYAARILGALPKLPFLLLPIIIPASRTSKFRIQPYAIVHAQDTWSGSHKGVLVERHDVRVFRLDLKIVQDELPGASDSPFAQGEETRHSIQTSTATSIQHEPFWSTLGERWPLYLAVLLTFGTIVMWLEVWWLSSNSSSPYLHPDVLPAGQFETATTEARVAKPTLEPTDEAFSRVANAYDLEHLDQCRVIYVGAGGASAFVEDMARAGVGEHYLVDPDTVSLTNIATQQVYRRDVGRLKVDCIAERILDINPKARVMKFPCLSQEVADAEWWKMVKNPYILPFFEGGAGTPTPKATLLCGLTDNFEAQAHVNRLALQFGIPSLCAQVYHEGRGAEISFTVPGITPACHRCALASRYAAYLNGGFQNDVTSHGTPIFATTRLNALKGFIALAILHHGTDHPRWGGLIERIGDRNLVLLRLDPDIGQTLGLPVFDRVFGESTENSVLFDEAIWRPQKPDNPSNGFPRCPDCGGSGDLRDAIGTFDNTLPMRF